MTKTLARLLRPAVRFCLRHALHIQDIEAAVKQVLVEVAAKELEQRGQRPNVSRLSAATGLHRRDVMRLHGDDGAAGAENRSRLRADEKSEGKGLISRIIGRWQYDKRFLTPARRPKTLSFDGAESEFHELVRSVSNDLNPGTVLRELERVRAAEKTPRGLKLIAHAYQTKKDAAEGYRMLGEDIGSLVDSVEENINSVDPVPNLHARTEFDNIYSAAVPEIRDWLLKRGTEFHHSVRDYLARFDRDFSPRRVSPEDSAGIRIVVGTFSLSQENSRTGVRIGSAADDKKQRRAKTSLGLKNSGKVGR